MNRSNLRTLALSSLSLVAMAMSVTGCYVGASAGGGYTGAWYNVYGSYCGSSPSAGCNFYSDGSKITAGSDPYYASSSLSYGTWTYTDSYGYPATFFGWGWQSPTGVLYNEFGTALNSDSETEGRDLIGNTAVLEKQVVRKVGQKFADKYALAEDTGIRIASTLNEWATLSKKQKRARTDQDVADFSKRLYGISVDQAKKAIDDAKSGSMDGLTAANGDVATYWGTDPETSKAILKNWYKDQLSEVGLAR